MLCVQQDFVISIVFTLLWLIASAAWADGVSKVKYYTNPHTLFLDEEGDVYECEAKYAEANNIECKVTSQGNFASLNVSIVSIMLKS